MALPYQTQQNILYDGFSINGRIRYNSTTDIEDTYNMRSKAIIVNVNSEKPFFVPTICLKDIIAELDILMEVGDISFGERTYLFPIPLAFRGIRKTSSAILKEFLAYSGRIVGKISTNDTDEKSYIGGKGIIMNKEWNPMIIWGYMVNIIPSSRVVEVGQPTVYISQEAYNSDDMLGKYIVRNVAPVLASSKIGVQIRINSCRRLTCIPREHSIRLITEDFSHLIYSPEAPTSLNYANVIQDKLIESLEDDH